MTVESLTLRPIVRAWAVTSDHTVLVARDMGGSELARLPAPNREYLPLAQLPLPAQRIVAAPQGWIWLRCWPSQLAERASKRPFARELLVLSPAGEVGRLLTMEGVLVQTVAAAELVLVAASGGALHAFFPDGRRRWSHPVAGWPATPEQRVWADPEGGRVWVSERGGVTELDGEGAVRWSWEAPAVAASDQVSERRRSQAAQVLGIPADASPTQVRRAFRRRAKETHPDHHPDEPDAAHRFRVVAQAYAVLIHQERGAPDHLVVSDLLEVGGVWPAGPERVWVATRSGSWHLIDGEGRELEDGRLRHRSPVTLAVNSSGELVAAGGADELELADGRVVPVPAGWHCSLRATGHGVVAHCREGVLVVGEGGTVGQANLQRPARGEWVGDDLYLFCAEGDFWRLRPGSPPPPASPP